MVSLSFSPPQLFGGVWGAGIIVFLFSSPLFGLSNISCVHPIIIAKLAGSLFLFFSLSLLFCFLVSMFRCL